MKKIFIYSLSLLFLFFLAGVGLSIYHIYKVHKDLRTIIDLHRIELIRKDFLINLQTVQGNLYTTGSVFGKELDIIVENVSAMDYSIKRCMGCHHSEDITARLMELSENIEQYKEAISYFIISTANPERVQRLKMVAVGIGDDLLFKMQEMIFLTDKRLTTNTIKSINKINKSRYILIVTIVLSLFTSIIIAIILTKKVTKPINALVKAAREIGSGNFDYKISYHDKTEFGELAGSFNEMTLTLRENIKEIEESEKKYRELFENAKDAIFILDAEGKDAGRIVAANKAAAEMHGYSIKDLLSLNIKDLDVKEDAEKADARIKDILAGRSFTAELQHYRKDGSIFPVEATASLLEIKGHKYILAFDRDISDRKQAEERLMRAETMKICGELTTSLAHEIKNPLAGIKGSVQLFSETAMLSDAERGLLQMSISEIKRVELLIKDILNFAKPPKPQFSSVDVNHLLDSILAFSLQSISSRANAAGHLNVVKDFDKQLPPITADHMQLNQSFLNLILNAAEEMTDGGTLTVKTSYDELENAILIIISDTGRGIEKEKIEQIFNPFFTTKSKGTGLGLAITKRLIEQHEGSISCKNNPDKGAAFMIRLPVKQERGVQSA